jgi:hypothetical protein
LTSQWNFVKTFLKTEFLGEEEDDKAGNSSRDGLGFGRLGKGDGKGLDLDSGVGFLSFSGKGSAHLRWAYIAIGLT